jgi:hypothetical protein
MHKFFRRSRLVAVVKFSNGCKAVALRVMADSKTQMAGGYGALLLIRELLRKRLHMRNSEGTETADFNVAGKCSHKQLLYYFSTNFPPTKTP